MSQQMPKKEKLMHSSVYNNIFKVLLVNYKKNTIKMDNLKNLFFPKLI